MTARILHGPDPERGEPSSLTLPDLCRVTEERPAAQRGPPNPGISERSAVIRPALPPRLRLSTSALLLSAIGRHAYNLFSHRGIQGPHEGGIIDIFQLTADAQLPTARSPDNMADPEDDSIIGIRMSCRQIAQSTRVPLKGQAGTGTANARLLAITSGRTDCRPASPHDRRFQWTAIHCSCRNRPLLDRHGIAAAIHVIHTELPPAVWC